MRGSGQQITGELINKNTIETIGEVPARHKEDINSRQVVVVSPGTNSLTHRKVHQIS